MSRAPSPGGAPEPRDASGPPPVVFYCISSAAYFLGAVAMINSLRLQGHDESIHVLDCGLSASQAELLGAEATVTPAPGGEEPYALKPFLPLARPAETMVLIDTDVIVTRPLGPLIEDAARGRVVAFRNHADRWVEDWGRLLGLDAPRRSPYVCSGLIAVGRSPGEEVLRLLDDRQRRVDYSRSYFGRHDDDYPLLYADQDVLNAILASQVQQERIEALPAKLAPMTPFEGIEVVDPDRLACAYADGSEPPYLLHHSLSPKPWQHPVAGGTYPRLLRRLLAGPNLALRVPAAEIPPWLRGGTRGLLERARIEARNRIPGRRGSGWGA